MDWSALEAELKDLQPQLDRLGDLVSGELWDALVPAEKASIKARFDLLNKRWHEIVAKALAARATSAAALHLKLRLYGWRNEEADSATDFTGEPTGASPEWLGILADCKALAASR